jgi:hypothetical protein
MSFGDTAENDLLELIFKATDWANIADDTVTSPETNLGVALHTTPGPGDSGTQLTNEAAYTSYAREDIARTGVGWSVTTNVASPAANIDFTEATGGSETETHFSIGKASGDYLLFWGTVTPNIVVSSGVTPRLTTATTITLD